VDHPSRARSMAFALANLPNSPGVYCWSAGRFRGEGEGVVTGANGVLGHKDVESGTGLKMEVESCTGWKMEVSKMGVGLVGFMAAGWEVGETRVTKSLGLTNSLVTLCLHT